jgi:hypothetical protein
MENLPELEEVHNDNKKPQVLPAIIQTPEDLVEWMLSFLASDRPNEEWIISEVHILIPAEE